MSAAGLAATGAGAGVGDWATGIVSIGRWAAGFGAGAGLLVTVGLPVGRVATGEAFRSAVRTSWTRVEPFKAGGATRAV